MYVKPWRAETAARTSSPYPESDKTVTDGCLVRRSTEDVLRTPFSV